MQPNDIWQLASDLRAEKERVYGIDTWRSLGLSGCLEAAVRKAMYLKAQMGSTGPHTEKFREDLLDLINWATFAYCEEQGSDCPGKSCEDCTAEGVC